MGMFSVIKWRTIDTAPKDGTIIDLWLKENNDSGWRAAECYWGNKGWEINREKLEDYFAFEFKESNTLD